MAYYLNDAAKLDKPAAFSLLAARTWTMSIARSLQPYMKDRGETARWGIHTLQRMSRYEFPDHGLRVRRHLEVLEGSSKAEDQPRRRDGHEAQFNCARQFQR